MATTIRTIRYHWDAKRGVPAWFAYQAYRPAGDPCDIIVCDTNEVCWVVPLWKYGQDAEKEMIDALRDSFPSHNIERSKTR